MVMIAIVVCSSLYGVTLIPGIRQIFSIPTNFSLNEIIISVALAISATVLMEVTKLGIKAVKRINQKTQVNPINE